MTNINVRLPQEDNEHWDKKISTAKMLAKKQKRSLTAWFLIAVEEKIERDESDESDEDKFW